VAQRRRLTKRAQLRTSFMLPEKDRSLLYAAALQLGVSQSEAVRQAVRAFAMRIVAEPESTEITV
jgi:hypothetical protein